MYEMQKKLTWSSLRTGIVITLALVFLFMAVFFSGNITALLAPKSVFIARFENVQGLRTGAPIWLFGVEIGTVESIRLTEKNALVTMSINQRNRSAIRSDAHASIMTMGILGDKYIELNPGSESSVPLDEYDTIPGVQTIGFEEIMSTASLVMGQLDTTLAAMNHFVTSILASEGTFGKLLNDPQLYNRLNTSALSLARFARQLSHSRGSLSRFMQDTSLYANLNSTAEQLSSLVGQFDRGLDNGSVAGALINDEELAQDFRQTITSLKGAAEAINTLITDVRTNPRKYFNFSLF